ncbi:F-box protein At5g49610-like [Triticum urartu]|uniref:F-box protein At5g49610-like n=1 Tax=Triticum urartu TaxID=4572 RepID=UPI00204497DF|nr:F-box protein At5g49610-like [Triticum urartu]
MAKAARAGATPSLGGLLEEIVIWEILVRLPPKALLRCRAVCRSWRSVTSTHDFLLAHHALQPALPLLDNGDYIDLINNSIDICCLNNRPGLAAPDQLQSVALLKLGGNFAYSHPVASCDGILIFCIDDSDFFICNPATRQYAPLLLPTDRRWTLLGMYPHTPTGEYRLLLYSYKPNPYNDDELAPGGQVSCHVLSLGSGQPPRRIGCPDVSMPECEHHVLFRGNLHWFPSHEDIEGKMIVLFDTTSESLREMRAPVADYAHLFEVDGKLGMAILDFVPTIDIWMLQNYEREVWAFNCRIELPVTEIRGQCNRYDGPLDLDVVVVPGDGELLMLVKFAEWLIRVGMDGKLVAAFHRKEVDPTYFQLKQSLVPHNFFPTLDGYVVNALPFI